MKRCFKFLLTFLIIIYAGKVWSQKLQLSNSIYRIVEMTDSFNTAPDKKVFYRHSFTYDAQGRPTSHTWDYIRNDKKYSSSRMMYQYDSIGRLHSKISDTVRYAYYYDANGSLRRITLDLFIKDNWKLYEETLLKDETDNAGKNKVVLLIMNKRRYAEYRKDSMDMYSKIEYTIDSSNNVIHSKIYAYSYNIYGTPAEFGYAYDNKPNPLQHIFIQRWYETDLEDGGLTNLVVKASGFNRINSRTYEYNEAGYPTKCVIDNKRVKYYKYARIEVPVQKTIETLNAIEVKQDMMLFPNPATTEVTMKADSLGDGIAQVRLISINGIVYKSVQYQVHNKLQALIPLGGIPKGVYVVEILAPKATIRRKLMIL